MTTAPHDWEHMLAWWAKDNTALAAHNARHALAELQVLRARLAAAEKERDEWKAAHAAELNSYRATNDLLHSAQTKLADAEKRAAAMQAVVLMAGRIAERSVTRSDIPAYGQMVCTHCGKDPDAACDMAGLRRALAAYEASK